MNLHIDYPKLWKKAEKLSKKYLKAKPFPHYVIDNFFTKETYKKIQNNFPKVNSKIWKAPTNIHTVKKYVTKRGIHNLKETLFSENQRQILHELNSSLFLNFLEKITSIPGLVPDPYFAEASFAYGSNGGHLDIHADFSHHDKMKLERRINVIFYLNDNWKKSYAGNLNLYNQKLKLIKKIFPISNRVLIFSTSKVSYHGYPDKIKCGSNVFRKSINMYYYTLPTKKRSKMRVQFPEDINFSFKPTTD